MDKRPRPNASGPEYSAYSGPYGARHGARLTAAIASLLMTGLLVTVLVAGLRGPRSGPPTPHTSQPPVFALPAEPAASDRPDAQEHPVPGREAAPDLMAPAPPPPSQTVPANGSEAEELIRPPSALPSQSAPVSPPIMMARPSTPPPAQDPPDADTAWRSYQVLLWQRVMARRPDGPHLSGEATLRFTLDTRGGIIAAAIERSSGNRMLDRIALRALRDASPFPPPPTEIRDRELTFTIRFRYNQ